MIKKTVAAAAILDSEKIINGLTDFKKLTAKKTQNIVQKLL